MSFSFGCVARFFLREHQDRRWSYIAKPPRRDNWRTAVAHSFQSLAWTSERNENAYVTAVWRATKTVLHKLTTNTMMKISYI